MPVVGRIAAGGPILAEERIEDVFPLPRQLVGDGQLFLLEVSGESMIDAAICHGDYVVIRQQPNAENGEIVAAMIDGEATVKTFQRKAGKVWLLPTTMPSSRSTAPTRRSSARSPRSCDGSESAPAGGDPQLNAAVLARSVPGSVQLASPPLSVVVLHHSGGKMRHSLVVLILAAAVLLGLAEPSPVVAAPPAAPVLVAGDVPDGADITAVSVLIDPTDDVLAALEIGETGPPAFSPTVTTTVSGTHFEVRVDPTTIPRTYLKSDGLIFAMVTVARDDAESLTTMTSARAVADPATGEVAWVDALESSTTIDGHTKVAGRVLPALGADSHGIDVQPREFGPMFGEFDPTDTPAGCGDRKLGERTRSTTIGTTYPVGGDKASMSVSSSTGASYGTAYSITNSEGVFGSFRASAGKFTRSSWGFDWDASAQSRSYRKGILYGKFLRSLRPRLRRVLPVLEADRRDRRDGQQHRHRPPRLGTLPPHRPRPLVARRLRWQQLLLRWCGEVRRGIGIDLSISREYNSSQKVWYRATRDRRMCGSDNYPAMAGKVMMRLAT